MSPRPRIAGIGELLWDRFPDGDRLGGAPANFAFHAAQLGAKATIISRLGDDDDGRNLSDALIDCELSTALLQNDFSHRTGIVNVTLQDGQPEFVIEQPAAWDFLELTDDLVRLASQLDAVCFGTLAQRELRSRETIQTFVKLCSRQALRLFDVNLRQQYHSRETIVFGLEHASVVKLNRGELVQLATLFGWPLDTDSAIVSLLANFPPEIVALTLGDEGCELHTRQKQVCARGPKVTCINAVGAGDAFAAALAIGLLAHQPLEQIADEANALGAYVATQSGAMPPHPANLSPL